jgi:deoxyribodipyrimidine photolyase-related protein
MISSSKNALILYPHQLFPLDVLPEVQTVVMVEEPLYFGIDREHHLNLHKHKLILHRASMRRYVEEVLWPAGYEVEYLDLDALITTEDIFERARKFSQLYIFDPIDNELTKRLLNARRQVEDVPAFELIPSPNFYLNNSEIQQYFSNQHTHIFSEFYQWQRERFNILIDAKYQPVGGKWMHEKVNLKKPGKDEVLPSFEVFGDNRFVSDAIEYVRAHFPDNPGGEDFIWPTSHKEAAEWLADFVEHRLDAYADYYETIDSEAAWLYHSALSASLNIGLLSPTQVVNAALERHHKKEVPVASLELFIRNIIGWREFIRGQYLTGTSAKKDKNVFKAYRKLSASWYQGTLGLPPFDNLVRKLQSRAYVSQPERLSIAVNLMLIAEIDPHDIQKWFSEQFIDAYDWVLSATLHNTLQFTQDDNLVSAPIATSKAIMQMSDYEPGEWTDVWDGLFWRFVENHRDILHEHAHTRPLVQRLDRLDPDRKRIIGYRAEDFLNMHTQ